VWRVRLANLGFDIDIQPVFPFLLHYEVTCHRLRILLTRFIRSDRHPFTAAQSLRIVRRLAAHVAPALGELTGDRVMEVLLELSNLSSFGHGSAQGLLQETLEPFIAACQLINHPVTVHP